MIYDAGKMESLFRSEACIVVKYIRPVDLVGMLEHINTIIYLAFPYTYETAYSLNNNNNCYYCYINNHDDN